MTSAAGLESLQVSSFLEQYAKAPKLLLEALREAHKKGIMRAVTKGIVETRKEAADARKRLDEAGGWDRIMGQGTCERLRGGEAVGIMQPAAVQVPANPLLMQLLQLVGAQAQAQDQGEPASKRPRPGSD